MEEDIVIRRTAFGVPHILANNLFGAAKGLAYAQMEDHGEAVVIPVIRAQGRLGLIEGMNAIDSDVFFSQSYEAARYQYDALSENTKAMLEGFASGINTYLFKHRSEYPQFKSFEFHGVDIAAVSTFATQIRRGERIPGHHSPEASAARQSASRSGIRIEYLGFWPQSYQKWACHTDAKSSLVVVRRIL